MVVDLNADVGEGFADDERLLDVVTSANVACGFHAGSAETMRMVCAAAAERGVAIGAHPSYRDREGFGRRALDVPAESLRDDVAEQLATLRARSRAEEGACVTYVKPHGALYTRAIADGEVARAIVDGDMRATASAMLCLARLGAPRAGARRRAWRRSPKGSPTAATRTAGSSRATSPARCSSAPRRRAGGGARAGGRGAVDLRARRQPGRGGLAAQVRAALVEAGFTLRRFA